MSGFYLPDIMVVKLDPNQGPIFFKKQCLKTINSSHTAFRKYWEKTCKKSLDLWPAAFWFFYTARLLLGSYFFKHTKNLVYTIFR